MTQESFSLQLQAPTSGHVDAKESAKKKMINKLVRTDAHFKHQQRGEPDLSHEEKSTIALDILNKSSTLFLERFSRYLNTEDTQYFEDQKGDYLIDFYREDISKRSTRGRQNVVKNRRFRAMQKLMDEGEYFSMNEMKWRDPLLYEQMVGQYFSETEKEDLMEQDIDKSDLRLSSILLKHMDMQTSKQLWDRQKENEDQQEEEEESDEDVVDVKHGSDNQTGDKTDNNGNEESDVSETERSFFRSEFLRTMQEKFLSGRDDDFDYSKVDNNTDFDALDIVSHDAEEKYFDAEEDSNDCNYSDSAQETERRLSTSMDSDQRGEIDKREGIREAEN